jgi:hypothetical protein
MPPTSAQRLRVFDAVAIAVPTSPHSISGILMPSPSGPQQDLNHSHAKALSPGNQK